MKCLQLFLLKQIYIKNTYTIQYNNMWVTCAKHITNDELLYTHKSQGNDIHINTFYSK